MSAPQVVAAAITFGTRYAFKNAFGIMTGDDDNDGQINHMQGTDKMSGTTVPEPPKDTKGPATLFERAVAMFEKSESSADLETFKFNIQGSDKYTKEEKDELVKLANNRIAELGMKVSGIELGK